MRYLLAVFYLTLGLTSVAVADYDSCICIHDADTAREDCLRWTARNLVPDSACGPDYNNRVRACQHLRNRSAQSAF